MMSKYWEDFRVGDEVTTQSITITDAHLVNWAGLTMDFYPLHMDEEYAKKTMFKSRIAHGPLTFAMAVGLVYMTGIYGDSVLAWLGVESMKLPLPVRIGDTIKVNGKVIDKRKTKHPLRGVIKFSHDIRNQREETVMMFDYIVMMHRTPPNA
jgi:acyl dehydratase